MRVVIPSNATSKKYYRQKINLKLGKFSELFYIMMARENGECNYAFWVCFQIRWRAQITALPARNISQASITVSRPQTPTTYHVLARVQTTGAASIQGPRATITAHIRILTPPISVANLSTYVRQSGPSSLTSSPSSAINISQKDGAPTWMPNVQVPSQLIRSANITTAPRARVVAQTIPAAANSGDVSNQNATIMANVASP